MPAKTLMLGLIGTTKNGTQKTEIHYQYNDSKLELHQETGYVVASLPITHARDLAKTDDRWNAAIALYDLHVGVGKVIP